MSAQYMTAVLLFFGSSILRLRAGIATTLVAVVMAIAVSDVGGGDDYSGMFSDCEEDPGPKELPKELGRWCCRRLAWVLRGSLQLPSRSQRIDDPGDENRQSLLNPDSFTTASMESSSSGSMQPAGYATERMRYSAIYAPRELDTVKQGQTGESLERAAKTPRKESVEDARRLRVDDRELDASESVFLRPPAEHGRSSASSARAPRKEAEPQKLESAFPRFHTEMTVEPVAASKVAEDAVVSLEREGSPGRSRSDSLRQSFTQAAEKVRDTDFREDAAGAAGAAASAAATVAGTAAIVAASAAGNAAASAAGALRSGITQAADKAGSPDFRSSARETLSRSAVQAGSTLQTTGRAAQQAAAAVAEAKTRVPKAAAVAAAAAGAAKDKFAKASNGFAGMFRRKEAPSCPYCMSSTQWTDYEGANTLGWSCEHIQECGSCAESCGPFRWCCTVCQTYDLCGSCAQKAVQSPPRSPPRKISSDMGQTPESALSRVMEMGFDESSSRAALAAAGGGCDDATIEAAVAQLLG